MADAVELRDLGHRRRALATEVVGNGAERRVHRHVGLGERVGGTAGRGHLEDQAVVGTLVIVRHHAPALPSASAKVSISSFVRFSVTATSRQSACFLSSDLSGSPARMPCFASFATTRSGDFGSFSVNSLKKGWTKRSDTPGMEASVWAA